MPRLAFADAPDGTDRARLAAALRSEFADFFSAGGVLALAEWDAMTPDGRAAALLGRADADAERVARLVDSLAATAAAALRQAAEVRALRAVADEAAADAAKGSAR